MKVFLISHKSDVDGVTPVILSKIVFGEIKYLLLETYELNQTLIQLINDNYFNNYDVVYITDLSISKEICDIINSNQNLKSKIKIFDHHKSNLFVNDYSFGTAIDINEKEEKESGTSLFYKHLLEQYKNNDAIKQSVISFVELVRQHDTWEWSTKYNNIDAKRLSDLFDIFGEDYFINHYYQQLINSNTFSFSEKEIYLLDVEQTRIDRYIEQKKDIIISVELLGYKVGLVFAENYRSELGNRLAKLFEKEYDFIILVNLARSISYRGIKNINLGEIAGIFGGKGHVNSSGSELPKDIHNEIIKRIFEGKAVVKTKPKSISIYDRIKTI